VFYGYAHLSIPPAALKYWFGVDDPTGLTSSSMIGTSSSGTADVSVGSDGSLLVDVANMTFTKRSVRVKAGTLVPRRPTNVASHRITATRGKVTYDKATSRGSKVRSYVAKCLAVDGSRTKTGTADATDRRVVVRHLHAGVAYDCRVKATSRAGASRWSASDRMPRRP
jgi:plastocyanin